MRKEEFKEGLGDLAHAAELDHEVQMARSDLYKIAKYAIKLHDMLKGVSEQDGLEGWVQAKITKAAEGLGNVYHNLDYKINFEKKNEPSEELPFESAYKSSLSRNLTKNIQEKSKTKTDNEVDEAHGNSKIYDKCWDGYKKVPGKKRGEKGSCVKK
tara:strand:+ start:9685 stop:10152 length:468 start_codon:yes stop_codon:yes gene_type:complete